MDQAIKLLQLLNIGMPTIVSLVATLRHADGTTSTVDLLKSADDQFTASLQQINDWMNGHKTTT